MTTNSNQPKKRTRKSVFSEHVPVRMTKEMKEQLEQRDKRGDVPLSALIRKYLERGLSRQSDTVTHVFQVPELENLRPELNRLGVNLNQIIRGMHTGKRIHVLGKDGQPKVISSDWVGQNISGIQKTLNEINERLAVIEQQSVTQMMRSESGGQNVHHEN